MKRRILALCMLLIPVCYLSIPMLAFAGDAGVADTGSASASAGSAAPVATVPSLPDVEQHPLEAATTAWQLLKQYGYVWGGMIVLFALGTVAVRVADKEHWLSKDHALPVLVSLLGILGATLEWKFAGASLAVVFAAIMASVMLVIQKPKPSTTATGAA